MAGIFKPKKKLLFEEEEDAKSEDSAATAQRDAAFKKQSDRLQEMIKENDSLTVGQAYADKKMATLTDEQNAAYGKMFKAWKKKRALQGVSESRDRKESKRIAKIKPKATGLQP